MRVKPGVFPFLSVLGFALGYLLLAQAAGPTFFIDYLYPSLGLLLCLSAQAAPESDPVPVTVPVAGSGPTDTCPPEPQLAGGSYQFVNQPPDMTVPEGATIRDIHYTRRVIQEVEALEATPEEKLLLLFGKVDAERLGRYDVPFEAWAAHEPQIRDAPR